MSCLRLKDVQKVPNGGWRATQPETGKTLRGTTRDDLAKRVREYREANNLPVEPNFARQLGDQICLTMEEGERAARCRYLSEDDSKNPPDLRAWKKGKQDLKDFAIAAKETLLAHAKGEPVHVGKGEADRRAGVCASCPHNVPIAPCTGCSGLAALYREIAVKQETRFDALLKSCGICGCHVATKVWLTEAVADAIAERQGHRDTYPDWCWMNKPL